MFRKRHKPTEAELAEAERLELDAEIAGTEEERDALDYEVAESIAREIADEESGLGDDEE